MALKSIDRVIRKLIPSAAKLSYNPGFRVIGNIIAAALGLPFAEFRSLPPNHLRVRVGVGNRIFNNHAYHVKVGQQFWLEWFSLGYANCKSDIVEIGSGCGRIAQHLMDNWFQGTFVGIDIDREMITYCRSHFPQDRFAFILSPHKSKTYSMSNEGDHRERTSSALSGVEANSKDFVYSTSLYTHLLEKEVTEYTHEAFRILREGGSMYMTFFCMNYVDKDGRWTFMHKSDNAFIENETYPEAAVAYSEEFIIGLANKVGFREAHVIPGPGQSVVVARK